MLNTKLPAHYRQCLTIPGLTEEEELRFLLWLCEIREREGTVVELGTFQGRSAVLLGQCVQRQPAGHGHVVTVDNYKMQHHGMSSSKITKDNLIRCDTDGFVTLVNSETTDFEFRHLTEHPVSLLFIDSHHHPKTLREEISHLRDDFHDRVIVAMHDFCRPQYPGYTEAIVKDFMHPHAPWECLGVVGTLIAFRAKV